MAVYEGTQDKEKEGKEGTLEREEIVVMFAAFVAERLAVVGVFVVVKAVGSAVVG